MVMKSPKIVKFLPNSLSKCMGSLGGFIARHSATTFFAWTSFMLVLSLPGFNKMEYVTNNERLFVPYDAVGLKVLRNVWHTDTNHSKMFINSPLLISQAFPSILRKYLEIRTLFTFYKVTSIKFTEKNHISKFRTILTPKNGDGLQWNLWTNVLNLRQCALLGR